MNNIKQNCISNYETIINDFINKINNKDCKLAFITSGGCSVKLEKNTVRKIVNFSTGTRGALSAEYFLKKGYDVIFLYKEDSKIPFYHKIETDKLFDNKYINSKTFIDIKDEYNKYANSKNLFLIKFEFFEDYINKLYYIIKLLKSTNLLKKCLIYLAAAISDFYIPEEYLPKHKIQSKDINTLEAKNTINLTLYKAPKELYKIKKDLFEECFLITFKLETDESILEYKSTNALKSTCSNIVLGNLLHKRYDQVNLYVHNFQSNCNNESNILDYTSYIIKKDNSNYIEENIIEKISELHDKYIKI